MVPPIVVVVSHFLVLSRKPIGSALGSSCLKSGIGKTGFVLILMMYIYNAHLLGYTTILYFYVFISHILTLSNFLIFHDRGVASLNNVIFTIGSLNTMPFTATRTKSIISVSHLSDRSPHPDPTTTTLRLRQPFICYQILISWS